MKRLTIQEFQEKLSSAHPKEDLIALEYRSYADVAKVQCKTCGKIYEKIGSYFIDKRKVSICKICFPTQSNQLKDTFPLPEGYKYIEHYKGMSHKVLIQHSCGFIWGVTPTNIKLGKGCPKCNKKISKGEQKIINWLETQGIVYQTQIPLVLENHHLFVDFYLPDLDIYIEYNGEQHYKSIKHFGGEEKFLKQKNLDNLKRNFLNKKLLEIPYTFYNKVEEILESSTTNSLECTQQALAVEVEKLLQENKENDIVSTSMETQSSS